MVNAGYRLDCAPDFPNVGYTESQPGGFPIWGWTDHNRRTVWIWADEIPEVANETLLRYLAQHELGHVLHPDYTEREVDGWAYCTDRQSGVRYGWTPTPEECVAL